MSSLSITTSPMRQAGSRHKITVNERVERILYSALQEEDEPRTASADARNEDAMRRSRQLSNLYTSSMEDKFVRSRMPTGGPKSVPKNAHLARRKVTDVPPIPIPHEEPAQSSSSSQQLPDSPLSRKPGKCYAKLMLKQVEQQEDEERRKIEALQFRAPDFSPPKPWYKGYASSSSGPSQRNAPVCSVGAKVRRYGAYGAIKMLASESTSGTVPPFRLHESQSLDAIAFKDTPDPWSPPLHGSPTLWPEDANFATGSKLQINKMLRCPSPDFRFPHHVVGKMAPSPQDHHYAHMQHVHAQDARTLEAAFDDEKARRRQEVAYNKDKLDHWKQQLHFEPLASKMDHAFVKVHATRAKELTILHNPDYSPHAKYNDQVDKLTQQRFTLRWPSLAELLEVMKKTPCRRPVLQDIEKLFALAYEISLKNLHHLELNRQQFWELLTREYPLVDLKHVNRVFSSYDCRMEDRLDMRVFLATVRAMRVQQGTPLELLSMALLDFDISKRQVVSKADHFIAVLAMCSGSERDEREMRAAALDAWHRMARGFAEEKETRRQRRLRGLEAVEKTDDKESEMASCADDEAQSEIESLLFLGRDDEPHIIPIQYVRKSLRQEKQLLQSFTEMLLKRRDECSAAAAPVLKPQQRIATAMAMAAAAASGGGGGGGSHHETL